MLSVLAALPACHAVAAAGYEQCQAKLMRVLERLVYLREVTADYTYYGIASPWLQVCRRETSAGDAVVSCYSCCGNMLQLLCIVHSVLFESQNCSSRVLPVLSCG